MHRIATILIALVLLPLYSKQDTYFIAIKPNVGDLDKTLESLDKFKAFMPGENEIFADPMLFKYKGKNYLFFEKQTKSDPKKRPKPGEIYYSVVNDMMELSKPVKAFKSKYHNSFPYIFEENNTIYMIPETHQLGMVSLYKSVWFPRYWKRVCMLVDSGHYCDSVLFKHNDLYWIFTTNFRTFEIYFSQRLVGPYLPHPINKKKITRRCAGGIFYDKGRMLQATMNNTPRYGSSMTIKEIVTLTPEKFVEKKFRQILPNWFPNLCGNHTFNINEDLVVYDGILEEK